MSASFSMPNGTVSLNFTKEDIEQLRKMISRDDPRLSDQLRAAVFPDRLVNCTGHTVNIYSSNNVLVKVIEPDPDRPVCRARGKKVVESTIAGVPIFSSDYPDIENLPNPEPGTYFIVSRIVAYAVARDDLLVIDMQVKDPYGKTIGCRGLTRV